jgi:hypothetical protein
LLRRKKEKTTETAEERLKEIWRYKTGEWVNAASVSSDGNYIAAEPSQKMLICLAPFPQLNLL